MWKNTKNEYGYVAKAFHWLLGLSYIAILAAGFIMVNMEKSDIKWTIYGIHKAFGTLLLLLISSRIIWRFINIIPTPLESNNKIISFIARAVHTILYVLMFAMPASGMAMSLFGAYDINFFGLFEIPAMQEKNTLLSSPAYSLHTNAGLFFAGFIIMHIAASLFHHFYKKDQTLRRMLPW
ncbi:MAG: hypothetical protein K0Q51_350 [Rickettsiaceae bacterium]|jgi:cytochrome b561|nr:hypothetical protein [Rickettsiaceae bacterium]